MSDNQGQNEPSMEEILASIRRIISEDEPDARPAGEAAPAATPAPAAAGEAPSSGGAGLGGDEEGDEDILELTPLDEIDEPAGQSDEVLDLEAEEAADERPQAAAPPTAAAEAAVAARETTPAFAPDSAGEPAPEMMAAQMTAPQMTPQEAADAAWEASADAAPEEAVQPEQPDDSWSADEAVPADEPGETPRESWTEAGLVSAATAAGATAALSQVARRRRVPDAMGSPNGGETLEAFAARVMEPHLKEWLDANLERLVERVVRDEVRRLARRAEDD